MTRPPRAFEPDQAKPQIPTDLTGLTLYFLSTDDVPVYQQLHRKLLLISEDNNAQVSDHASNMIFGYVLNEPLPQTFRDHFGKASGNFPSRFQFLQIMNSATGDKFEAGEAGFITFITRKGTPLETVNEHIFGDFAAYTCETLEEANEMEKHLHDKKDIIMVHSLFAMERERLAPLITTGRVLVRQVAPDIILNQSAFMRTVRAFPEAAPNLTL